MCKNGEIRNVGNTNIMVTCNDFYIDTSKLIDLLIKILGTEDVYYLTMREVRDNTLFNRIHQNIIIVRR